ncbi:unnamed protein product, partial [Prorocentrum cordatum]
ILQPRGRLACGFGCPLEPDAVRRYLQCQPFRFLLEQELGYSRRRAHLSRRPPVLHSWELQHHRGRPWEQGVLDVLAQTREMCHPALPHPLHRLPRLHLGRHPRLRAMCPAPRHRRQLPASLRAPSILLEDHLLRPHLRGHRCHPHAAHRQRRRRLPLPPLRQ